MTLYVAGFNTASVLIQHVRNYDQPIPTEFQYSFCSYSTIWNPATNYTDDWFQYSFCSYSTLFLTQKIYLQGKFQYSFCSYSTIHFSIFSLNTIQQNSYKIKLFLYFYQRQRINIKKLNFPARTYLLCCFSTKNI